MPKYIEGISRQRFSRYQHDSVPTCVRNYLNHGAQKGDRNASLHKAAAQCLNASIHQTDVHAQLLARAMRDGLSEYEANKTINSAYRGQKLDPPHGFRPGPGSGPRAAFSTFQSGVSAAPGVASAVSLPAPIPDGFKVYLETCFQSGESVAISGTRIEPDGKRVPDKGGIYKRDNLLSRMSPDFVSKFNIGGEGLFIRINPATGDADKDVTSLRHGLFEADKDGGGNPIPKEQQYAAFIASRLPISALVESGNVSIHALVRFDAPDVDEYKRRYALASDALAGHWIDPGTANRSRFSRAPGAERKNYDDDGAYTHTSQQELLAINVGEATWDEWEAKYTKDPRIAEIERVMRFRKVSELSQVQPAQLVEGLLYEGTKMMFAAPSKSFKTWNLLHFFFCLANGLPYLGRKTPKVPVVYFDFELLEFDLWWRPSCIAAAYNLHGDPFGNFHVVSLCGQLLFGEEEIDFSDPMIRQVIINEMERVKAKAFAIDPIYMTYCGEDENSNSGKILSKFDPICRETGAAFIYNHHFAKGDPSIKSPFDRVSGAGVFSRNPYTEIVFTPHVTADAYTVNFRLRGFMPIAPCVVRWQMPLMLVDPALDPKDLATAKTASKRAAGADSQDKILSALYGAEREGGLTKGQLAFVLKVDPKTIKRNTDKLINKGEIMQSQLRPFPYQLSPRNAAAWLNVSP